MRPCVSSAAIAAILLIAWSGKILAAAPDVDPRELIEARDFLEAYRIADAGEAPLSELYSDHATVHIRVPGKPQAVVFPGRAIRVWNQDLERRGKSNRQGSVFQAARVERRGEQLLIRARRYSATYCYWDNDYRVTIKKEAGNERIVDEHLGLQPASRCQMSQGGGRTPMDAAAYVDSSSQTPDSPPVVAPWQPLSQDEIAAMALTMARDSAPKSPAAVQLGSPPPPLQPLSQPTHQRQALGAPRGSIPPMRSNSYGNEVACRPFGSCSVSRLECGNNN